MNAMLPNGHGKTYAQLHALMHAPSLRPLCPIAKLFLLTNQYLEFITTHFQILKSNIVSIINCSQVKGIVVFKSHTHVVKPE